MAETPKTVTVKARVKRAERDAFRRRANERGQSMASRIAWLIRQDLQGGINGGRREDH
jgi:hypothetical protein